MAARLKTRFLTVCLDANVYVSGLGFGGRPLEVIHKALNQDFSLVISETILSELKRNLINKIGVSSEKVERFLQDILNMATIYEPKGQLHLIKHKSDNLILETALMGFCDVLVTGDKKHLLPLGSVGGLVIETPSIFLQRWQT